MPVDRILVRISAQPRLASVVKTAVVWEARQCGLAAANTKPLVRAVLQRFRGLAEVSGSKREACLNLSIEPEPGKLRVRIGAGTHGRTKTFRARTIVDKPRKVSLAKGSRKHPSV